MKTARRCFKTAIAKYDSAPVLSRDYIEYDGGYYVIGEGRKGFVADKQTDDDNYMLTLAAIVKELEARGMTDSVNRARIHLAVGLPLKWVQAQREDFKRYMLRNSSVEVGYKDRLYCIEFAGCTVMPQCYSAVTENLKDFAGVTLLADIGNGTMNLMYLNNGRPMESKAWTEKLGVFQCFQKIHNMVQDKTGDNLMDDVIDNILRSGKIELPDPHASLVEKAICDYVEEIFQKLRDHEYNEKLMPDSFKGMELIVRPAEKVNMTYDAINIRGEDTTISPTIYINDMYEKYQSCGDLEETLMAACDLMAMEFAKTPQVVDVDSLYKDADEKVVFQLINSCRLWLLLRGFLALNGIAR